MLKLKLKTKQLASIFISEKNCHPCARTNYSIDSEMQGSSSLSHFSLCSVARTVGNTSFKASSTDANGGMSF